MRSSQPPLFATFVLKRLGPQNEPLVGDLLEEYRSGRSRWWYWRQTIYAIAVGAISELWGDKLLVVRAIATGVGLQSLVAMVSNSLWNEWPGAWILSVAQTASEDPPILPFIGVSMLVRFPSGVCIGWLLAKLNREHQGPVALTFVLFALLGSVPGLVSLVYNPLEPPRFLDQGEIRAVGTALMTVGVLLGTLMSAPTPQTERVPIERSDG